MAISTSRITLTVMKKYLLGLLLFIVGCSSSNGPASNMYIMPLAVGNRWIGNVTVTDSTGAVLSTQLDTLPVYGTKVAGGETWYFQTTFPKVLKAKAGTVGLTFDTVAYAFTNRSDGLYRNDTFLVDPPRRIAKYPASVGDTVSFSPESIPIMDFILVHGIAEPVTVPAGTFSCYHYQDWYPTTHASVLASDSYYAPGVGLVEFVDSVHNFDHPYAKPNVERWQLVRADLH